MLDVHSVVHPPPPPTHTHTRACAHTHFWYALQCILVVLEVSCNINSNRVLWSDSGRQQDPNHATAADQLPPSSSPWRTTTTPTSLNSSFLSTTWTRTTRTTLSGRWRPTLLRCLPRPPLRLPHQQARHRTEGRTWAPQGAEWAARRRRRPPWPARGWTTTSCRSCVSRSTVASGAACTTWTPRWMVCARSCPTPTGRPCASWARSPRCCWPATTSSCSTARWTKWRSWSATSTTHTRLLPEVGPEPALLLFQRTCTAPSRLPSLRHL